MVFQYSREAVRRLHRQFADAPLYTELPVGPGLIPTWALFLLHARRDIASSMGLSHGFGTGLLFAVTATLPMIAGYAVIGEFDRELTADAAFTWIFIAGIFEELVYRGFVFGQLFRYARWGFCPRHY